ncbi:MAG: TRAP transporter substrate-binding protein [Bdellovibrionota bacterium]
MKNARMFSIAGFVTLSLIVWELALPRASAARDLHLLLAHNLAPDHPVHLGMEFFAKRVDEESKGRIHVTVYPSGQLGTEKEVLELVQTGAVSMTKVSSLSLEGFTPLYGVMNLPFLFRDREHFFGVLDGAVGTEILDASRPQALQGLTFYDAGERSFYAKKPIEKPDDVRGLKIRVMENATAIRMMQLLGGNPTPMGFGEVYTALEQGVIDGAENNITALTISRHGEVAKYYSIVQHIFAPDVLLISRDIFDRLSPEDRVLVKKAADDSKVYQREVWQEKFKQYEAEARDKLKVQILRPDKQPFIDKVLPLHEEVAGRGADYRRLIEAVKAQ